MIRRSHAHRALRHLRRYWAKRGADDLNKIALFCVTGGLAGLVIQPDKVHWTTSVSLIAAGLICWALGVASWEDKE